MNLNRRFVVWNAAAGCYLLMVATIYFALRGIIVCLHAEGFLAMFFSMVYSFGTPIFFDLIPVIFGVAGVAGIVAECRQRHLSSSWTWLVGAGAALSYFVVGCLFLYVFFTYAA